MKPPPTVALKPNRASTTGSKSTRMRSLSTCNPLQLLLPLHPSSEAHPPHPHVPIHRPVSRSKQTRLTLKAMSTHQIPLDKPQQLAVVAVASSAAPPQAAAKNLSPRNAARPTLCARSPAKSHSTSSSNSPSNPFLPVQEFADAGVARQPSITAGTVTTNTTFPPPLSIPPSPPSQLGVAEEPNGPVAKARPTGKHSSASKRESKQKTLHVPNHCLDQALLRHQEHRDCKMQV